MLDWKILLAILAALLLLTGGLVKDVATGMDSDLVDNMWNVLDMAKDTFQKLFNFSPGLSVPVTRNLNVSADINEYDGFQFKGSEAESISLSYRPGEANVTADGKSLSVKGDPANIQISTFDGEISISPGEVGLDGKVDTVSSENIDLKGDHFSFKADGEFETVKFTGIKLSTLKLKGVSGELHADKKVTLDLEDNPTTVGGYLGNMTFSGGEVKIDGKANKVSSKSDGLHTNLNS